MIFLLIALLPPYLFSGEVHSRRWGKRRSWRRYQQSLCTISPHTQSQQLPKLKSRISSEPGLGTQGELGVGSPRHPKIHRGRCFPTNVAQPVPGWLCCKMSPKLQQVPGQSVWHMLMFYLHGQLVWSHLLKHMAAGPAPPETATAPAALSCSFVRAALGELLWTPHPLERFLFCCGSALPQPTPRGCSSPFPPEPSFIMFYEGCSQFGWFVE